jgi:beta-mannosidase
MLVALSIVLLQSACNLLPDRSTIEIQDGWEFRRVSKGDWHRAVVPGCVHTDLLDNDLIPDPFYGTNEKDLQWIEREDWEYRAAFDVKKELLARANIELDFEGLDTYADVFLNDSLLFNADNMFREWRASCKGLLREKANLLRVYFHSPVNAVQERWSSLGYELPGGPRVLTRKAAYQYGWDWGPRFVTSGIWRPVRLRSWDEARITGLHIVQRSVTQKEARFSAQFEIESAAERRVTLSVYCGNKNRGRIDVDLAAGRNSVELDFSIPEPKLWWTNGLGMPNLYHFLGEIRTGGEIVDWVEERVGIRTIELVQENDAAGKSFYFKLNGVPVFMKGANYIPQDNFLPRVTRESYESLIGNAANAGMNMLRVWGGGVYEDDIFYDLCDENGILVWQDFMFACAMYPGDDAFLASVRQEAIENVKRLRNHPCIALWCGNNEIDEAWHNWGWQRQYKYSAIDSARIWGDYGKLFHELLPAVVEELDPGKPYRPSSPSFGRADPRSLSEGDSHYWGVWHDGEPFEAFNDKVPRFMSEFGFQSFPLLSTIKYFARPEDWNIDSEVMRSHQKHPRGNELIRTYMERSYHVPQDFESFLYVSRLLQAEGVRTGIEAHRRAMPYCMGSLYWQLNDCWPVASWSSVDYFGAPKALYYFARNANSEVLVSPVIEDGTVRVYVVSDRLEPIEGLAVLKLVDFSGEIIWVGDHLVKIRANSSSCFFEADAERLLRGHERTRVVLSVEMREGEELLSKNLLYFASPKELDLPPFLSERPKPVPRAVSVASISENDDGYSITLCATSLVKNLFLTVEGHDGVFDDNYFDMLPGSCVTVHFITPDRIDHVHKSLKMMSLVDTY